MWIVLSHYLDYDRISAAGSNHSDGLLCSLELLIEEQDVQGDIALYSSLMQVAHYLSVEEAVSVEVRYGSIAMCVMGLARFPHSAYHSSHAGAACAILQQALIEYQDVDQDRKVTDWVVRLGSKAPQGARQERN